MIVTALALLAAAAPAAEPWHEDISYGGGGHWPLRVPVKVANRSDRPLAAEPVVVTVDADGHTAPLAGEPVRSLRVVPLSGPEVKFDIIDGSGRSRRSGKIAAGDRITIPVDVPAEAAAVYYLYAGNTDAWLPPEWPAAGIANPGFESGGRHPDGWRTGDTDASHRVSRQKGGYRGAFCARCDVDDGAKPSWVKYYQPRIHISPGRAYRFSARVKAAGVKGNAGWFVHVHGEGAMLLNRSRTRGGTCDWQEAVIEFTAPDGAVSLTIGTILRGTGTAWYDCATLESTGDLKPAVTVLPAERKRLRTVGEGAAWAGDPRQWPFRIPVRVRNVTEQAVDNAAAVIDARRIDNHLAKLRGFGDPPAVRLVDGDSGAEAAFSWLANERMHGRKDLPAQGTFSARRKMIVRLDVPAGTEKMLWLYIDPARSGGTAADPAAWSAAGFNLLENGDMERGDGATPAAWEGTGDAGGMKRVKGGTDGDWCLRLRVPAGEKTGWRGWRQRVAVRPATRYLLAGYLKTDGAAGAPRIHGHFHRADGSHTDRAFFSTGPGLAATQDWTMTATEVTTPRDCAYISVHLTTNRPGAIRYDSLVLAEVCRAETGDLAAASGPAGLTAWAVDRSVKTFRDDLPPPGARRKLAVFACRNERECCQLALRSPEAATVSVSAGPLSGPGGASLPKPAVHRAHYVPVDFPVGYDNSTLGGHVRLLPCRRGTDGWRGWWPDPLLPAGTAVELAAGETASLWLDFTIPRDAKPGAYAGTVTLAAGGRTVRVPVAVTVWDVIQPDAKHLPALYDLRNGPGTKAFDRGDVEKIKRWYRFLADYNVSPGFIFPEPTFAYRNGQVTMDAAAYDEMASFLFDQLQCPAVYTPRIFYAAGWARLPKKIFGLSYGTPAYRTAWSAAYRTFIDHVTKKGWRDRIVYYLSDEPHESNPATIAGLAAVADMARTIAPDVPIYSSTWRYIDGLAGHLTMWGIGPHGSFDRQKRSARRKAGDRFWYTTDGHMCTDTPLLAVEKLLPWLCFKYGVAAYEFWGVSWWTLDPWERGWHWYIRQSADGKNYRWVRYPNGDGFLAYPGGDGRGEGPFPTIRLLAARDGVEDYEIFLQLRALADAGNARAKEALAAVEAAVSMQNRGGRYSTVLMPDPAAVRKARIMAGAAVDAAK